MKTNITQIFRMLFIGCLAIVFLSFFVQWYSYNIYSFEGDLLSSWNYHIFREWISFISIEGNHPDNVEIPFVLNIIFLITIFLAGYVVIFKNIEKSADLSPFQSYRYIVGFVLCLNIFYVICVPVIYFFPHELYFPSQQIVNYDLQLIYELSVGPGYIMQLVSFPFIFSYALFYIITLNRFTNEKNFYEKSIEKTIEKSQETLDIDKLIAKEEVKLQLNDKAVSKSSDNTLDMIINSLSEGGRK